MGIDSESNLETELQIGPTTEGMVRIYVFGSGVDLPMDFEPDDADAIAEELRAAAETARRGTRQKSPKARSGGGTEKRRRR